MISSRALACLIPLTLLAGCGGSEPPQHTTQSRPAVQGSTVLSSTRIASEYYPLIQQIYLAYFGRPADAAGLAYYAGQYLAAAAPVDLAEASRVYDSNAAVRALIDSFSSSQESQSLYGGDNSAFVGAIYRNLFSREADADGLAYWAGLINKKLITRANAAVLIMAGSQQSDLAVIANKTLFAQQFTASLVSDADRSSYSGLEVNAIVRRELLKITASADASALMAMVEAARRAIGIQPPVSTDGKVASVREGDILDTPGYGATGYVATATGLYMQILRDDDITVIAKLHKGAIGMLNSWSSAEFARMTSWAVSSIDNDPADAMSFYWAGSAKGTPGKSSYGLYALNTGDPGTEVEDDIRIAAVAAGGQAGIIAPKPWVIANGPGNINSDDQYVFQEAVRQSGGSQASKLFTTPADKQARKFNGHLMLAHPSDPTLFVGDGNVLRIYDSGALVESIAFAAEPFISIHTMLWAGDSLWIGYGDKIYRRTNAGQLSLFMTIQAPLGAAMMNALGASFCLQNGEVYTVDGTRKNIFTGAVSNWISTGTLTQEKMLQAVLLRANLTTIYCHPDVIWSVYAPGGDGKIRVIQPLP